MIVKFELHQRQHFSDHLADVKRYPFSAIILEYCPNTIDYIARPVAVADNRLESQHAPPQDPVLVETTNAALHWHPLQSPLTVV